MVFAPLAKTPTSKSGTIDSYSFRVPLVMFAPSAFKKTIEVQRVTSHVDIDSSVARLLGLRADLGTTQGYPLWVDAGARRVYFFAEAYGGADGYHQGGYFMRNAITETYFQNSRMEFSSSSSQILHAVKQEDVANALADFKRIHRGLLPSL